MPVQAAGVQLHVEQGSVGEAAVIHAIAAAHNRLALASDVVGEPDARTEVHLVFGFVGQAGIGVEVWAAGRVDRGESRAGRRQSLVIPAQAEF